MSYKSKRAHRKNQKTRNFVPKGGDPYCAIYSPGTEAAIQAGMKELGVDRKRFTDDLCELFRANGGCQEGTRMLCTQYADPADQNLVLQLVSFGPMLAVFEIVDINELCESETLGREAA
jgi:hypothetical protein